MRFLKRFIRINKNKGDFDGFFQYDYKNGRSLTISLFGTGKHELLGYAYRPICSIERISKEFKVIWKFRFLWIEVGHIDLNNKKVRVSMKMES